MGLLKTSMLLATAERMYARHEKTQQQNSGYAPPPYPPYQQYGQPQQYGSHGYSHTSRHAERHAQRAVRRDMRRNPPMPHADYGGSSRRNDGYNQGYQGGYYDGREAGSYNQGYHDGYGSRDAQAYYEGPRTQYAGCSEGYPREMMNVPRYEGGYGGLPYQQQERGIVDVPEGQRIETAAPPAYKR